LNQNWKFMCAESHSTAIQKNYDAQADRFVTKWAEISVGREACHGQGSNHVAWAQARQSGWPFSRRDTIATKVSRMWIHQGSQEQTALPAD
jgi:hypothetical protein